MKIKLMKIIEEITTEENKIKENKTIINEIKNEINEESENLDSQEDIIAPPPVKDNINKI